MRICVGFLAIILASALPVDAVVIDFETDGNGDPTGGSILSTEYSSLGVTIMDSVAPAGSSFLNDTNPVNVGTAIQGKYVNVGALEEVDTFLEVSFSGVSSVGFDWATGVGADFIVVSAFGIGNVPLGMFNVAPSSMFVNPANFTVPAGGFFFDGGGDVITRLLVEDQPGATRALILDNLRFEPVPEPSTFLLLAIGSVGVVVSRRRE